MVNTVSHGVIYFDLKQIAREKEQLELSDSQNVTRLEESYSVSYLINWAPGDLCVIMS